MRTFTPHAAPPQAVAGTARAGPAEPTSASRRAMQSGGVHAVDDDFRTDPSPGFPLDFSRIPLHAAPPIIHPLPRTGAFTEVREADSVAGPVMRVPAARLQPARIATGDAGPAVAPPIVHDVLRASGHPLDAATRAFMEPRFGHDFGQVRVHDDQRAHDAAAAIGARAYTLSRDIVFDANEYAPETDSGRRLLAHELTHVVQQGQASRSNEPGASPYAEGGVEARSSAAVADASCTVPAGTMVQRASTGTGDEAALESAPEPDPAGEQDADPDSGDPDYLPTVDTVMDNVSGGWSYMLQQQHDGVQVVADEAERAAEEPNLNQRILVIVGELLIGAAVGGMGLLVAKGIERLVTALMATKVGGAVSAAAANTAKLWADGTRSVAEEAGKKALEPSVTSLVMQGLATETIFFESQKAALIDAAMQASEASRAKKLEIRKQPHALEIAKGHLAALKEVYASAKQMQVEKTVQAWLTYMAQVSRGTEKQDGTEAPGTDVGPGTDPWIFDTPGVLYLKVNSLGEIKDASIKGATDYFINLIVNKRIRDIAIPKIIEIEWGGPEDDNLTVRINETGTLWLPARSQQAGRQMWLQYGGGQENIGPGPGGQSRHWYTGTDEQMWQGARNFVEGVVGGQKPLPAAVT